MANGTEFPFILSALWEIFSLKDMFSAVITSAVRSIKQALPANSTVIAQHTRTQLVQSKKDYVFRLNRYRELRNVDLSET